jgi:hypothetical protein
MMTTLPLQPGAVRLMLIRDVDTGAIVDADVFFDGDEAVRARAALLVGLDGEFRDYRPEPGTTAAPMAHVSADLPGLPGVPAGAGPVICPDCEQRTGTVHHRPNGDGTYSATLVCQGCGGCFELGMNAYSTGLTVGCLVEAARRGDPRVIRPEATR